MKQKSKNIIRGISFLILLLFLMSFGFNSIFEYLKGPNKAIRECIVANKTPNVIGIEYSCALQEAVRIYEQDPDGAIALCLKYSSLPKDSSGRMICRTAIELSK